MGAVGADAGASVTREPGAPAGAGEGARLAKQRGVVVAPSHDAERPPAPPEPELPSETGLAARLSLGVGGALWISGGDTKLSRPFWFGLDLGYAVTRNWTVFARGTSWFPYDNLANEFVGVGAAYRFVAERVYVAPALGASFTRQGPGSDWSHYFQGLALEADVGQYFPLPGSTSFSFGAHFQIGTPLLGKKPDAFTSLQAGIFVALGLH
jgi:hypothetical protein